MSEHASIVRLTRFRPASGKRDDLVRYLQQGVDDLRRAEGCFGAQICSQRENPDTIVSISRWASQSAVDQWAQSTRPRASEMSDLIAGQPESEHFVSLS